MLKTQVNCTLHDICNFTTKDLVCLSMAWIKHLICGEILVPLSECFPSLLCLLCVHVLVHLLVYVDYRAYICNSVAFYLITG